MAPVPVGAGLRASCLINNYDYAPYLVEAVASACAQTRSFDEIVVVDDGSTDDSVARVRERFGADPRVVLVEKTNGGQLSCFHSGLRASHGDLLFFLDADDVYEPGYLARAVEVYRGHPECHGLVSAYREFGKRDAVVRRFAEDRDLGYSAVLALTRSLTKLWVSPTSTLSFRRGVLERFLPLPRPQDWRTRADDCLLFGSAMAGARKRFLAQPWVGYRIHADNRWYGRTFDAACEAERERALGRLLADLVERLSLDDLAALGPGEFARNPDPTLRRLRHYLRVARRAGLPWAERARQAGSMATHLLRSRIAPAGRS